jgi:hypothetical protein
MKMIWRLSAVALFCAPLAAWAGPVDGGFIKTQAKRLVDDRGSAVLLRGFGLGNWYLPEGYMWKFGAQGDRPRKIEVLVEKVLGKPEGAKFWRTFRDNYINENDIRRIAALGFNSVRPALKARDFLSETDSPVSLEEGFQRLDQLIAWCRKYNLYVILDLHAAPGGQTGKNIDDSAHDYPELFKYPRYQKQTEELWVRLATRYKDNPVVAGYDLLNEPLPDEFKQYKAQLEPLYKRLARAIRKVDSRHMLIVEGNNWANDWSSFGAPFDSNLCYQFHKYWNDPDRSSVQGYIDFQERYQVPVWVGEFGESKVGSHWYWATTQLFEDLGWGWSFWPWKKLETQSSPYSIRQPRGWEKIQAVANGGSAPARTEGLAIMNEFLKNIRMENCLEVPEVASYLLRRVPSRFEAEDFGHLGEGRSYHAKDTSRRASRYRHGEAVDLEPLSGGQGYNVGWMEKGEWLQYELECDEDGLYDFSFRMAAEGAGASFRLEQAGKDISGEIPVPATGGWTSWKWVTKKALPLKKGKMSLRFFCTTGGYNFDYFLASLAGRTAPARPQNSEMRRGARGKIPGRVEAEDFGAMGEGRSYHDSDAANQGGALRGAEGVDIQAMEENSGLALGLVAGEWLSYEINSLKAQRLRLNSRLKSDAVSSLSVMIDGRSVLRASLYGDWTEKSLGVLDLPAGKHTIAMKLDTGAAKFDWFELVP